jgi:hypothetical protein
LDILLLYCTGFKANLSTETLQLTLKSNCNNKQHYYHTLLFVAVADNIPVALMGWTGFVGIWNFPLKSCCSSC